ncbi:MAG: beta-galactosidase [Burkholderiaceae bacterium]|nr:MAG: beta-galactosidase [Burkholderiaceae bacterium]
MPTQLLNKAHASNKTFGFATDDNQFLLNGKPLQIRSGEMHPARIPKAYWRHRIQMAKAMGMNTIAIYVMWNYHEQQEGAFDFTTENRDMAHFVRLCQEEQLHVILRPGPYVCAEWDLGGIPSYLLAEQDIVLRANSHHAPRYMQAASRYIAELAKQMRPLMLEHGGPILMVQIENEFGSYGNDHEYLEELRQLWLKNGINGPFYTQDGYDQLMKNKTSLAGAAIGLSGGESADILKTRKDYPKVPVMSGELYPGWLTHWGDPKMQGKDVDLSKALRELMNAGQSFNFYVIHGGTNFGFTAGANTEKGEYQPDVTSYDYAAPMNEQGEATAAFHRYRHIIEESLRKRDPKASIIAIPKPMKKLKEKLNQPLQAHYFTSIWDHLPTSESSTETRSMESLGQNQGLILYQTTLPQSNMEIQIQELHDYALIHVDQHYQAAISRSKCPATLYPKAKLHAHRAPVLLENPEQASLSILVEGMGHINYGRSLIDRKGIVSDVMARTTTDSASSTGGAQKLQHWKITRLPLDTAYISALKATRLKENEHRHGHFFKTELTLTEIGDCFIEMKEWVKGMVWVNDHNLGRYWRLGPQHRLYCPATFLKKGKNTIIIFDFHLKEAAPFYLRTQLEE